MNAFKITSLVFVVLVTGCGEKLAAVSPEQALTEKLKLKIAQNLNDPSSVQFRNLKFSVPKDGDNLLCGEINGKNQYGGYAGFRWFAVFEKKGGKILDSSSLAEDQMMEVLNEVGCGYPKSGAKG